MSSTQQSIFKSAGKTLDTTRFTTCAGTGFGASCNSVSGEFQGSKIDQAYKKAIGVIDQLITLAQECKEAKRMGIKNIGDTNEYILDACQEHNLFTQPPPLTIIRAPQRQLVSEVDLQKLQLLKVIESQRNQNLNLSKRCQNLQTENYKLRESCVSTNFQHSTLKQQSPYVQQPVRYMAAPVDPASSRIFAELQNLKYENEQLRQETIRMLESRYY